jgi:hypothetical protein
MPGPFWSIGRSRIPTPGYTIVGTPYQEFALHDSSLFQNEIAMAKRNLRELNDQ